MSHILGRYTNNAIPFDLEISLQNMAMHQDVTDVDTAYNQLTSPASSRVSITIPILCVQAKYSRLHLFQIFDLLLNSEKLRLQLKHFRLAKPVLKNIFDTSVPCFCQETLIEYHPLTKCCMRELAAVNQVLRCASCEKESCEIAQLSFSTA